MQVLKAFCCVSITQFFEHLLGDRPKNHSDLSLKSIIDDLSADSSSRTFFNFIESKGLETTWLSRICYIVTIGSHMLSMNNILNCPFVGPCGGILHCGTMHLSRIWHEWIIRPFFETGNGWVWWATWERRACRQVPWLIYSLRRSWRTELKCAPLKVWLCAPWKIFTHPPGLLILQCWRPPGTTVGKHLTFNFYFLTFRMGINQRTDFTELCWSGGIRNVPGKWRGFERWVTPLKL